MLVLGGLGLQPLGGLPVIGGLATPKGAPPSLPTRVEAAVDARRTVPMPRPATAPRVESPASTDTVPDRAGRAPAPSTPTSTRARRPSATSTSKVPKRKPAGAPVAVPPAATTPHRPATPPGRTTHAAPTTSRRPASPPGRTTSTTTTKPAPTRTTPPTSHSGGNRGGNAKGRSGTGTTGR